MLHEMAQNIDYTKDLPLRPSTPIEAKPKTVYYGQAGHKAPGTQIKEFRPERYVRSGVKRVELVLCCRYGVGAQDACPNLRNANGYGKGEAIYCKVHGGGKCVHERNLTNCVQCNPNLANKSSHCSRCVSKQIAHNRRVSQGGGGICLTCEKAVNAEAAVEAAAQVGQPAPPAAKKQKLVKRQELKMLERLVLAGYDESFNKGVAPRPGEFTREVYVDHRCALGREFALRREAVCLRRLRRAPQARRQARLLRDRRGRAQVPRLLGAVRHDAHVERLLVAQARLLGRHPRALAARQPGHQFALGDATHNPSTTARCDAVCALLDAIEGRPDDPPMAVAYAFYQMRADGTPKVLDDPDYHADVRRGVVLLAHVVGPQGAVALEAVFE